MLTMTMRMTNVLLRGFCTLNFFLVSIFFHSLKFKYVHIHTLEGNIKKKIENFSSGVRDSTERPKIRRFWRKGYRKN